MALSLERLFLLEQIGDIHTSSNVSAKSAVRTEMRNSDIRHVAIFTVVTAEPILHVERLSGVKCSRVGVKTHFVILGVHAVDPTVAEVLLQRSSGKLEPGFIDKCAGLVGSRRPH